MRSGPWLVAATVLLGACATAPAPRALPVLEGVPAAFEMSGRIAVRQDQRNDIARLRWTHTATGDQWVFASPLGNEVARIESDGAGATLTQAGGEPRRAASFAALSEALVGVALEPAWLAGWLHGKLGAAPGDWKVTLDEQQDAGAVRIARRLTASRGDTVVRVVVDDYRVLP